MQKLKLENILALAGLAVVWVVPIGAIACGMPDRIPLHFDISGHVNRWGSSLELFFLPTIALFVFCLLSVVVRFPASFSYPVEVTPANRARLQELSVSMINWLKVEMLAMFAWIEGWTVGIAREGEAASLSGARMGLMLFPAAIVLLTVIGYIVAMGSAAGARPGGNG